MNLKFVIIGLAVVTGIVVAFIFAEQFSQNQQELENTPYSAKDQQIEDVPILKESETSVSTELPTLEQELNSFDFSDLDAELGSIEQEATGL